MAKIALLIGVSDYGGALTGLPGTQTDLQAMQRILESPQVGAFDRVDVLPNPNRTQMEIAIETLFTENRNRDDLLLLYFSGHGVRDDNGALYFAVSNTQKNPQGRIRNSTAVNSTALQNYMSQSRSKRQVLILDCCFSGAFAQDMKAKADEAIDVKAQLGGEGRAVLTSSTATQVSYEKEGASIYTRYLVQGLETGAADLDGNGQITVDGLHDYAREKVQEAAPTMKPEIYAVREGYKIFIARAPQGDPKLVFRKEADGRAKQKRGQFSPIDRRALKYRGQELGLAAPEMQAILEEILQPYQVFQAKLKEFEEAVKETLDYDPQLGTSSIDDLQYFQRVLKLRDEDIATILNTYRIDLTASASQATESVPSTPKAASPRSAKTQAGIVESTPAIDDVPLKSAKGVDYTTLRDLLKAGKWREADQETAHRMLEVVGRGTDDYMRLKELNTFPCEDLKTIDTLWTTYSQGRFGFSVQKEIWQRHDNPQSSGKNWDNFCVEIGWQDSTASRYLNYEELKADIKNSPAGEFP